MTIRNFAYLAGRNAALRKLGTVVGPIMYKAREGKDPFNYADNKQQEIWAEFDREPRTTGEESSIGMPSAGGVAKAANYASSGSGIHSEGSQNATAVKPQRQQIRRNEIDMAFSSNDKLDTSYGPEPSMSQPKFANAFAGMEAMGVQALKPKPPGAKLPGMGELFKPPKLNNLGTKTPSQLNPIQNIQSATNASDVAKTFMSSQTRLMGGPL